MQDTHVDHPNALARRRHPRAIMIAATAAALVALVTAAPVAAKDGPWIGTWAAGFGSLAIFGNGKPADDPAVNAVVLGLGIGLVALYGGRPELLDVVSPIRRAVLRPMELRGAQALTRARENYAVREVSFNHRPFLRLKERLLSSSSAVWGKRFVVH